MQRLGKLVCALVLAAAPASADEAAAPPASPPKPIYARSRQFSIPFSVEPASQHHRTVEVQLYVSTDGGETWRKYASVKPEAGSFRFQARTDGPYWFHVRTKDSQGQLHPQQPGKPELHVIVDTARPLLWLEAHPNPAGTVEVRWSAQDPHLDPASFRLEYTPAGTTRWQPIAAEFASGHAEFLPGEQGPITVRAEIADLAKNAATRSMDILQRLAGTRPPPAAAPAATEGSDAAHDNSGWQPASDNLGDSAVDDEPAGMGPTSPPGMPDRFPSEMPPSQPGPARHGATAGGPHGPGRSARGGVPSAVEPPLGSQAEPPEPSDQADTPSEPAARAEARLVNSRRFALEYELESVGPSGVARIELWQTSDGGETWSLYGLDEDLTSPMLVSVDAEGTYGFLMVVESGAGLRGPQPKPGDLPEISVRVDLTPPATRLLAVRQQAGGPLPELVIEWEAADEQLAARPISLLAAPTPGGPWTIVRANLENTGRFVWPLAGELPEELYLRLEVRDAAGNRRTVDTAEPIRIERVQPKSRIQQVRPLQGAARGPRIYRFR